MEGEEGLMPPNLFDPDDAAKEESGIFGLPYTEADSRFILLPVPWGLTASYGHGTENGPAAIFEASKQVDLYDRNFGKVYQRGIFQAEPLAKDLCRKAKRLRQRLRATRRPSEMAVEAANLLGDQLNQLVCHETTARLDQEKIVGLIGGEHSASFGAIKAHIDINPNIGVLHIDAHADLRHAFEGLNWSHASVMRNVMDKLRIDKLVQVGVRDFCEEEQTYIQKHEDRIRTFYWPDMAADLKAGRRTWLDQCKLVTAALPDDVYISLDIDGLQRAFCPHTGTPVPGGLDFDDLEVLLLYLSSERNIVGFDLVEVAPGPPGDDWDAIVGARALYKLIGAIQLQL